MKKTLILLSALLVSLVSEAQNSVGMSGLFNVPTAEMNSEGDAMIGAGYLNSHALPEGGFTRDDKRYNTAAFYLNLTPFRWVELSYTITLMRDVDTGDYTDKDRQISVKFNPLREGKWYPAIAIGCNDIQGAIRADLDGKNVKTNDFFSCYYIAATKHLNIRSEQVGLHLAYRHCPTSHNKRWQGVVGGLTYRPSFYKPLRAIVEYTGNEVNVGADCLLWKHLLLQASLQDGKYFSCGVCLQMNLF